MANDRPIQGVQQTLLGLDPEEVIIVNGRCEIHEDEGIRVAVVSGVPVARYAVGERVGEHLFVANAQLSGFATQQELSTALDLSLQTS